VSLFLFHWAAAAFKAAGAAFGDDHLRTAFATNVNFAKLVSHFRQRSSPCQCLRFELRTLEERLALFQERPHALGTVGRGL
jgi:hypothetical protein